MTKTSLLVAALLTLQSVSPAFAESPAEYRQAELLQMVGAEGAKAALASMSNEELIQAREDLRSMIGSLSVDLAQAKQTANGTVTYKIRNYAIGGVGLGILLVAAGMSLKLTPGTGANDLIAVTSVGILGVSAVTALSSEAVIVLSPDEASEVKAKINKLVHLLQKLDSRLQK